MDTNGNGMLDPDEAQGPARFMLDRMARSNPKIDVTKPIPMSTLTESFQQMRSGGFSSEGSSFGSVDEIPILEKDSLVPGFGKKIEKTPVPGFGASSEKFSVVLEERDLKEADDKMGRYDKNNDKMLDENELKEGRWSDSPMQYDRNRDGKLSRQELGVRYARRRLAGAGQTQDQQASNSNNRRDAYNAGRPKENPEEKKEKANPYEKRASYRVTDSDGRMPNIPGLPEWFTRNDTNFDGQVSMSEFNRRPNQDTIDDFARFDANQDGWITNRECLAAVKKGYIPGAASSPSSSVASGVAGSSSPSAFGNTTAASSAATNSTSSTLASPTASSAASDKTALMRDWVVSKVMKKADKDNNGFLSPEEYRDSTPFDKVDADKDGLISVDEYVASRLNRKL